MTPTEIAQARAMYDAGGHTVQEIADTFGVTRPTIYRHLAAGASPAIAGGDVAQERFSS